MNSEKEEISKEKIEDPFEINPWDFLKSREKERTGKRKFTFNGTDDYYLSQGDEFEEYLLLHNVLDVFSWIVRFHYAGDKKIVSKKSYRLEQLFQQYLKSNKIELAKIGKKVSNKADIDVARGLILRGWYNELIACSPIDTDYLNLSTQLSEKKGPGIQGDFTWKIVQHYYSVLDYCRSIFYIVDPTSYPKKVGYGVIKQFNNNILGKLKDTLFFYPFDVLNTTLKKSLPPHPKFLKFEYSCYPRNSEMKIDDLDDFLLDSTELLSKERNISKNGVLDCLYYLREWANYLKVEPLLKLNVHKSGYMKFLLKNLSVVTFFIGGLAELSFIARYGGNEYLKLVSEFSESYIQRAEMFGKENFILPLYVRLRIYKHLNYTKEGLDYLFQKNDPVVLIKV